MSSPSCIGTHTFWQYCLHLKNHIFAAGVPTCFCQRPCGGDPSRDPSSLLRLPTPGAAADDGGDGDDDGDDDGDGDGDGDGDDFRLSTTPRQCKHRTIAAHNNVYGLNGSRSESEWIHSCVFEF